MLKCEGRESNGINVLGSPDTFVLPPNMLKHSLPTLGRPDSSPAPNAFAELSLDDDRALAR